jgi:uncharacterized protein
MQQPRIEAVVVQPTPFCNIDCAYCYLPNRADRSVIALGTIETLFAKVFASGWCDPDLAIIWHAGEPLVLQASFYDDAFAAIAALCPDTIRPVHSIQTNGILIDDAHCELFRRWHVRVGVSIDGPRDLHDANRRTRSGAGTFDRTLAGLRRLRERDVPFHVITVLGEASLDRAEDLHAFYVAEDISHVCFNIEETEGAHRSGLLDAADLNARFRTFLRRFWQLSRERGHVEFIREVDGMIRLIFRPDDLTIQNHQVVPLGMLNVDWQGNVSSFSPEFLGLHDAEYDDYIAGNICTQSLDEIRTSPVLERLTRDIAAGVARCERECGYFSVCGGGAPINKRTENGSFDSTRTSYCELTQIAPADLILESLEQIA